MAAGPGAAHGWGACGCNAAAPAVGSTPFRTAAEGSRGAGCTPSSVTPVSNFKVE